MKLHLKLLLGGLFALGLAIGCSSDPQKVAPASAGERGTSCQAKNDCGADYSCISGVCQPANFDIDSTTKECYRVECAETADCCGDKPLDPPTKCRAAEAICSSSIPGCFGGDSCTTNDDCNGGTCGGLSCSSTFNSCVSIDDCPQDECIFPNIGLGGATLGQCRLSLSSCTSDANCNAANTCSGFGDCNCTNLNFNPSDPLCSDPDCEDVCTKTCENELCVEDNSCETDSECVVGNRRVCEDSECVECVLDEDCDSSLDDDDDFDVCRAGTCVTPCKGDSECGLFQACDEGECMYVGCKSDRECILSGIASGNGDPRLAKCVDESGVGVCKIKCEIDAHCALDETCDDGACKYIGCQDDAECKTILGLHSWMSDSDRPWVPVGECRAAVVDEIE